MKEMELGLEYFQATQSVRLTRRCDPVSSRTTMEIIIAPLPPLTL